MIIEYYNDSKQPLNEAIRRAIADCRHKHGAHPVVIAVRADELTTAEIDGIPVQKSTSGLILRSGHFEFHMPEIAPINAVVVPDVIEQRSLF